MLEHKQTSATWRQRQNRYIFHCSEKYWTIVEYKFIILLFIIISIIIIYYYYLLLLLLLFYFFIIIIIIISFKNSVGSLVNLTPFFNTD